MVPEVTGVINPLVATLTNYPMSLPSYPPLWQLFGLMTPNYLDGKLTNVLNNWPRLILHASWWSSLTQLCYNIDHSSSSFQRDDQKENMTSCLKNVARAHAQLFLSK